MAARLTRRRALLGGAAVVAGGGGLAYALRPRPALGEGDLTVREAYNAAAAGDIVLIDIRRPDEWARTGVGKGAVPLDMRDADFLDRVHALLDGDRSRPVAVICAAGVRSHRMSGRMADAGFSAVIDVPEGMEGSSAGSGWVAAGLPVVPPR